MNPNELPGEVTAIRGTGQMKDRWIPPGRRSGTVRISSSKSVAHRVLICAALGNAPISVQLDGLSQDVLATANCLRALGAGVKETEGGLLVEPLQAFRAEPSQAELNTALALPVGESGSTLRFLLPLVGALGREAVFMMEGRLPKRPLSPLIAVLREHGMCVEQEGEFLRCSGLLQSGDYVLPGNVSSQYFSGLLMSLPLLKGDSSLSAESVLESSDYIRITEQVLASAGIPPQRASCSAAEGEPDANEVFRWNIHGGLRPQLPPAVRIEADWSNAAFFLCMGALSEQGISVQPLRHDSAQGDSAILQLLRIFGAEVTGGTSPAGEGAAGDSGLVTVRRGAARPMCVDVSQNPDLAPVLAVLCCAAEGRSEFTNASRLRLKESDRLQTTAKLIRSLGGTVEERQDGLTVFGTGSLRGGEADAHNDHRIAMSAAVASCLCREPVLLKGADCVRKSYPGFWDDFDALTITH